MRFSFLLFSLLFSFGTLSAQTKKYDSLQVIIKGSISIYKSSTNYYLEKNDSLYLLPNSVQRTVNQNGIQKVVNTYPYRGVLNYHLFSCNDVKPIINRLSLNEDDLTRLFKKYYQCMGETPQYVEDKALQRSFRIGLNLGFQVTSLTPDAADDNIDQATFESAKSFLPGISIEYLLLKSNLAFGAQFNFVHYDFTGEATYVSGNTTIENTFEISYNQVQARIYMKKYFGNNTKFFIKGGPSFNANSGFKQYWSYKEITAGNSVYESEKDSFFEPQKMSVAVHGGFGFMKEFNNKLSLIAEFGLEAFNSINDSRGGDLELKITPIAGQVILLYRLK